MAVVVNVAAVTFAGAAFLIRSCYLTMFRPCTGPSAEAGKAPNAMHRTSTILGYVKGGTLALAMSAPWAAPRLAQAHEKNACGCYQNTADMCFCERTSKCGCPGECEPRGCEESRQKQFDKEIQAETQKAIEAERKQREEAAEKERKANPPDEDEEEEAETGPLASVSE
jgi:hypothetical protein